MKKNTLFFTLLSALLFVSISVCTALWLSSLSISPITEFTPAVTPANDTEWIVQTGDFLF